MRLLSIGEILWDRFGDQERLGGAPLNVAIHARRLGDDAAILSAVGDDARGSRALALIREAGVSVGFISRTDRASTGTAFVDLDSAGVPVFEIARPAAYDHPRGEPADIEAVAAWQPDWIVYGTIAQLTPRVRDLTERVIDACPLAERLYDVNLRPGPTTDGLLLSLLARATAVKANQDEAARLLPLLGMADETAGWGEPVCRVLAERFGLRAACITRGALGAALLLDGTYAELRAPKVSVVDTVGSGDAFTAALVHGMAGGRTARDVVDLAVRVGSLVASRPGATPAWAVEEIDGEQQPAGRLES